MLFHRSSQSIPCLVQVTQPSEIFWICSNVQMSNNEWITNSGQDHGDRSCSQSMLECNHSIQTILSTALSTVSICTIHNTPRISTLYTINKIVYRKSLNSKPPASIGTFRFRPPVCIWSLASISFQQTLVSLKLGISLIRSTIRQFCTHKLTSIGRTPSLYSRPGFYLCN